MGGYDFSPVSRLSLSVFDIIPFFIPVRVKVNKKVKDPRLLLENLAVVWYYICYYRFRKKIEEHH